MMTSGKIINKLVAVVYTSLQIQEQQCLHMRNRFHVRYTQYLDPVLCFSYRATSCLFSMLLLMLTLLTANRFSRDASFASDPFAICKLYIETYVQQNQQMYNKANKRIDFPSSTNCKCNSHGSNVSGMTGIRFLFPHSAAKPILPFKFCSRM